VRSRWRRGRAPLPPRWRAFLRRAGFGPTDIAALESGQVIARSATEKGEGEALAVAAVKIRTSHDRVVRYYGEMIRTSTGR
jgi:hypothetical protein